MKTRLQNNTVVWVEFQHLDRGPKTKKNVRDKWITVGDHPRRTVARIRLWNEEEKREDMPVLAEGDARFNPKDKKFSYEQGRTVALSRALNNFSESYVGEYDKVDRALIWAAYHQRKDFATPPNKKK